MKNLIYQFWDNRPGNEKMLSGVQASRKSIKKYADQIGADHLFEENPDLLHNLDFSKYYGTFNPIFREEFHEYDNVLFLDADIHAVDGLEESIFENFTADIGICTEPLQPKLRANTKVGQINRQQDELWATHVERKWDIVLPRTEEGLLKVYNSGVVLYSNKGMLNAKQNFLQFGEYITYIKSIKGLLPFYAADQNYIHTTLFTSNIDFVELDKGWNTFVTYHERDAQRVIYDKDENTKLVHIQFRGANHFSEDEVWKVVNLPVEEWGMNKKNVINEIR